MVVSPTGSASTTTAENIDANTHAMTCSATRNNGLAVISGPEVCRQAGIMPRSLLDIAPTILTLFGIPRGKDMSGRPLADLFAGGLVAEVIETWDSPSSKGAFPCELEVAACSEDTAKGISSDRETQHLAELGYVDPLDVAASEAALHCERTTTLNRAISLMDAGLPAQAARVLEQLIQQQPEWYHSHSLLAETYYQAGHLQAARNEIDWLTCHGFENPQLYLLSAAIEVADRRYERALEELSCASGQTCAPWLVHIGRQYPFAKT